jgi:hypothetical protein
MAENLAEALRENKNNEEGTGAVFITLYFLLNLQTRPNKLACYITLGWKGLQVTNTPAMYKLYLAGLNLGRVFNYRCGCAST